MYNMNKWLKEMNFKDLEDLKEFIKESDTDLESVLDISVLFLKNKITDDERKYIYTEIISSW